MDIKVCIGSACHLKGSYDVIEKLKALIEKDKLGDKINLKASFCLGRCDNGVTVKLGEQFLEGVYPETLEGIYNAIIKPSVL